MGIRQVTVSDRTGKELSEKDKVSVVVRSHPDLVDGKARVFDVHRFELSNLGCYNDEVHLEINLPDGRKVMLSCTAEEFDEFFTADKLANADYNHGRRTGYSPNLRVIGE